MKQIYKKENRILLSMITGMIVISLLCGIQWRGSTEKCSGMVGQYLSGVLFFRMGSVWLRCRKISIRTEAKDILLACESY